MQLAFAPGLYNYFAAKTPKSLVFFQDFLPIPVATSVSISVLIKPTDVAIGIGKTGVSREIT